MFIDEITRTVLGNVDRSLEVISRPANDKVKFCNLKWLQLFNFCNVDGSLVQISEIDTTTNVVTFSQDVSSSTSFSIPDTVFFIGSAMKTSSEWLGYSNKYSDKVPFVWLNFPAAITSTTNLGELSPIVEKWNNVRLFFVADMDRSKWLAQETIDNRTKVLHQWALAYLTAQKTTIGIDFDDEISHYFYPIFGKEQENGSIQDIIEGNLSAVAIESSINVYEDFKCNC